MAVDLPPVDQLMLTIGYVVFTVIVVVGLLLLVMLAVTLISMRRGRFYFPWLLKPGLILLEGLAGSLWKAGKVDDQELKSFTIRLRNQLNREKFSSVPMDRRAIFLPHCLRSASCPADLTTEGLVCVRCMRCDIGRSIDDLEKEGYKVFIVPGSTFLKRMVKKYKPGAIIGVGCLMEVKEGLEMADRIDLSAMGVVTSKDGCVETTLDWDSLFEVARLRPEP